MANPFSELFTSTEQQYGLPEGYLERTARVESQFNPSAKNPNSSAGGLFQFIDGTAKQYGLADRYDPVQATDAAARLARDNAAILKRTLGRDPTAGELYLAHQQGAGGAVKLLSNPDAPAEAIVGPAAARLNGGRGLTAGQLAQKWTAKIDGNQPPQGGNTALAYAATRGRDPRANMPAPDATQAMGQMPMPPRQMQQDPAHSPDGGARDFLLREYGMSPDMQQGAPQGGPGLIERVIGGLGGLGGMRIPQGGGGGQPAPSAQPQGQPDIESLIPAAARDPFAIIGPGAAQNQQWEAERQGKIALAQELVRMGFDPRRAVGLVNTDEGRKLALGQIQQAKVAEADRQAVELLGGQGGQNTPAPSSPAPSPASAPPAVQSMMNDPVMKGTDVTTRATATDALRVLANPNASKALKDIAEKKYAALLEDNKLTSLQKEHLQARRENFTGGIVDFKKATQPGVTVRNEGTIPPGYQIERDAQGNPSRMVAIPGGPADTEAKQKAEKEKLGREQTKASATVVIDALDDIDRLMKTAKLPTTGALGVRLSEIGGTAASDIASTLKTIRANISFDKLSEMRAASATGAALGAVSDTEMALLANSAAALEQSQSEAQFKTNLKRLRERFNTVINGPRAGGEGDKQTGKTGGPVKAFTRADYDKLEAGSEYQDAEGNIRRKGGK